MRRAFPLLLLLGTARLAAAGAADDLNALYESEWERGLREHPVAASGAGDHRFDAMLSDLSSEALAKSEAADRAALERARQIPASDLDDQARLNRDMFIWEMQRAVDGQRFGGRWMPLDQQGGIQTFDTVLETVELRSVADFEHWIARLNGLDRHIAQTVELLKQGVETGWLPPRVVMQRVSRQIANQVVEKPEDSPFWKAFAALPDAIPHAEQERLRREARQAIAEHVLPGYRALQRYFDDVYLPACRDSIAATELPDGKDYYAWLAAGFTTTPKTPDEIHQIGLDEVARIRAEMLKIKDEVGFEGDLQAFFDHLRSDPKFFYSDPAELLKGYRDVAKRIDPELVKVFGKLPRMPYGVRRIPEALAPHTYTAYYQPGANDGSRAGYYYVNLYKPEARPKWEMMALSLHEAVPGHHFQFALGLELPEQPMFRRTAYVVAYGEGWALYAERLGYEMGLYDDPYDRFGQLTYDMWRAVRLVVDTGMHAKGWSRQKAIDYFKANAPKTEQDIVNEIDRYIAWPGQALAYKIGQLKILELRARAEKALGGRFDLRAFHDQVLGTGSVPLAVLEQQVDRWIAAQAAAGAP